MPSSSRRIAAVAFALALGLGAACTLNPSIPNARVVCDPDAPKCPSGFTCEKVMASVTIGVCCRTAGCAAGLTPEQIADIVDAGVSSGVVDGGAGSDGPTCTDEPCNTNPGFPCFEGRIECGSDSRACKDGPKARDGTPCMTNKLCINGACSVCTAGTPCQTNSDQCRSGVVVCDPVGCMNGTPKNPGATCGTDQVCSAAGTCIPCATGATCATNPGKPCKKGAIACSTGAPQCVDDPAGSAPDGTFCEMDKVCKAGVCTTCAAGTVCTGNPGGVCKLGVVTCGSASGCIDGDSIDAGTACGSNMVCNGNGQCVMCQAGKACTSNPGAPCRTGVIDCTTGAERCLDTGNTAAGTTCGTNKVCDGIGVCVSCTAETACTTNPSICRNGATSCTTGASVCVDGTPKPTSATCTSGQMCDGNGFCGACVNGQSCTGNPSVCKLGTASCTGTPSCVDGANRAAGSSCGVGMVCDSNGGCVGCASGQSCTGNPNPCKAGTTSCATGAQTCADAANKPVGSSCGADMVCNATGTCVACAANTNCTNNPNPCKTGITSCTTGAPVCDDFGNRSAGTSCGTGMVCNGNGGCVACTAGQSCTGNPSPCAAGVTSCATGAQTCVDGTAHTPGTSCGTNQVCNANGQCTLCTAAQACATNPGGACVNGVTSCSTGVQTCVDGTPKSPGTACGTNLVCNGNGTCVTCAAGGACGGNPSSCKSGVISCTTGTQTCVDGTGNVTAGTPCGSNQVCDGGGFCGTCTEGQSCSGNPNPCFNGTASCSSGTATCVNGTMKAAGTSCGTNMVCNSTGTCGACTAGSSCTTNPSVCKTGVNSCVTGTQTCVDDANKSPGVGCGSNMVCNGSGTCVACTAGTSCTMNPNVCKTGVTSCMTGAQTCVDSGNKTAGTSCGSNMVCNGSGTCVACTAGGSCTSNPNICKTGVTSCMTGAQTCVDGGNKAAGTGCGTNMVCNGSGSCVSCTAGGSCTGNPSVCKNGVESCVTGAVTCVDGSNKMGGVTCGSNMVCDGNGTCGSCTANQACATNPNPCFTGITSCMTGTMMCNNNTPRATGSSCGTNMVCNSAGTCVPCTAGAACTTNPNQCKDGMTSCMTGAPTCVDGGNKPDTTSCNDGMACTHTDVCKSGACTGTTYSCPLGQCQSSSTCDGNGGCIIGSQPNNTPCNDGMICTHTDVCIAGICAGTPYGCTPNQCQSSSTCNGNGGCTVVNRTGSCNDGNACSYNDACSAGICAGIGYNCSPSSCQSSSICNGSGGCTVVNKPNGSTCTDPAGNCCTLGGTPRCTNGICEYSTCCNSQACCDA